MKKSGQLKQTMPYAVGMISYNMEYLIIAQLTFALTESYAMSALTVGLIFLTSRVFDGFTDIIAGYVIDRCNFKIGKSRVYDLLHIPLWLCLILVFSVPDVGNTAKVIWVFVFYNLLQSVIATFMNVAEPLRLQRSVKEDWRVKAVTTATICTLLFGFICNLTLPLLIKTFAYRPNGWTIIGTIYAIPFAIFGMVRFFCLPELPETTAHSAKPSKVTIRESVKALINNKYAFIFGGIMICWAMYNTMTQGSMTYYFRYVYGDISGATIANVLLILNLFYLVMVPKLVAKFGKVKLLRYALNVTVISCLARLLMPTNIILLAISNLTAMGSMQTLGCMKAMLNIDCITYGVWKNGSGVEAAYSTVNSLADKIGLGIGSALFGFILQMSGYNGTLATQPASAVLAIKLTYTVIPATLIIIAIILFAFFDLDKKLPAIKAELAAKSLS